MKSFFDKLKKDPKKFERYYYIYVAGVFLVNIVIIVGFLLFLYFLWKR